MKAWDIRVRDVSRQKFPIELVFAMRAMVLRLCEMAMQYHLRVTEDSLLLVSRLANYYVTLAKLKGMGWCPFAKCVCNVINGLLIM